MKRLVLAFLIILSGCAFAQRQVDYVQLCAADPVCMADAKEKAALVNTIASTAYPPVAGAAAGVTLILALWWGGRKKKNANSDQNKNYETRD